MLGEKEFSQKLYDCFLHAHRVRYQGWQLWDFDNELLYGEQYFCDNCQGAMLAVARQVAIEREGGTITVKVRSLR